MGDNFEKLKMLERGASKAPWRTHLVDDTSIIDANRNPVASTFPDGGVDDDVDFHAPVEQMERDAAFIVAARNQIPRLIAEIERLREALAGLFDLCLNANAGAWRNGVTDATGTIDEGEVHASDYLDRARAALAQGGE